MSYNINHIEILSSDGFCIDVDTWEAMAEKADEGELQAPESNVFSDRSDHEERDGKLYPKCFYWTGEGSGWAFDTLVDEVLPLFNGSADLLVTWEGDDSFEGLRLRDHKVTRHEIEMKLKEEAKP